MVSLGGMAGDLKQDQKLLDEIALDFGLECFSDHASGIRLPQNGAKALLRVASQLKACPTWTVLLEGHCPGGRDENNAIRESVSEEAADMCKEHLQRAGVTNEIICSGLGSAQGLGMRVRMSIVEQNRQQALTAASKAALSALYEKCLKLAVLRFEELTAARKAEEEAAAARKALEKEEARKRLEEEVVRRKAAKAEKATAEARQKAEEKGAAKAKAEKDAARERSEKEAAAKQAEDEAVARRVQEEALALKKAEEEAERKRAEEEAAAAKQVEEEAAARRAQEEALALKEAEEEAARKRAEEEVAAAKRVEEEAAAKRAQEEALALKQAEEEAARKRAEEEVAAAKRVEEEAAAKRAQEEALALKQAEEEAARKRAEEEGAAAKQVEEEAAARRAQEEALLLQEAEEEAARTLAAEEAAAAKQAEEEAAAAKKAKDEAEAQMAEVEAAAAKEAEEEGARRQAEEEAKMAEVEATVAREAEEEAARKKAHDAEEAARKATQDAVAKATKAKEDAERKQKEEEERLEVAKQQVRLSQAEVAVPRAETTAGVLLAETAGVNQEELAEESVQERIDRIQQSSLLKDAETAQEEAPKNRRWSGNVAPTHAPTSFEHLLESAKLKASQEDPAKFGKFSKSSNDVAGDTDEASQVEIPDVSNLSREEKEKVLQDLTDKILLSPIRFEPNGTKIHRGGSLTVQKLAQVFKAFPGFGFWCVGHTKGRSADNNVSKRALSLARAESVREALRAEGVTNPLFCAGFGSIFGRGLVVKMHVLTEEEASSSEETMALRIPYAKDHAKDISLEQEREALDQLLKETLERGLAFEPNKATIKPEAVEVTLRLAYILKAFPNWAIRCEGHAKGQPADDNPAKRELSQVRADALKVALEEEGVTNAIFCVGQGCSQGLGMCVRMATLSPEKELQIPDTQGMTLEQRRAVLNGLLEQALSRNIEFEANKWDMPPSGDPIIRSIAHVLNAFPDFAIRCEGHTKGKPSENNEAKRKLSQARAEAIRVAVKAQGAPNHISVVGEGSAQGLGMCARLIAMDEEELRKQELEIPDTSGLSEAEKMALTNQLLVKALAGGVDFEPNGYDIPLANMETIRRTARVLKAFPDLAVKCEGHSKGQPQENNSAKVKLSHFRAEAVKAALKGEGAVNTMHCSGEGCASGLGLCIRLYVIIPEELRKYEIELPDTGGLSLEERIRLLDELLEKAQTEPISFEPNSADIALTAMVTVAKLARVLRAFPDIPVRCEGHGKGRPAENNDAKVKVSQVRANAVRSALQRDGVENEIECVGHGCSQGLGMCVRLSAVAGRACAGAAQS